MTWCAIRSRSLAYPFQSSTCYFLIKWVPKEFVDLGHSPAAAAMVLVYLSIGGLAGAL